MKRGAMVFPGFIIALLLGACEPPAKITNPAPTSSVPKNENSASPAVSASVVATNAIESAAPKSPIAPCPPEIPDPAEGLAWVSGCHILIRQKIVFALEKEQIQKESFPVLEAVGDILLRNPELRVEIEGHLGDLQREAYGRKLSQIRAESVRKYLIAKKSIAQERLSSKGYENSKPIADNRTEEGRAKNRRIEFLILSWGGEIK